ncbi:MAG: flagellar filament capping protein FliD [Deltaproteobacteria bacterium]
MSISVGGLVSGMDTDKIISQLQALQQKPITKLQTQEAAYQVKLTAYSSLQGSLKDVKNAARNLDTSSDITSYAATSSNTSTLTASAEKTAVAGSYSVTVNKLAAVHKLTSTGFSPTEAVGKGTIQLKMGSSAAVNIAVGATSTLSNIATSINAADTGIYASVINDGTNSFLSLTGKQTGAANVISLTVTEDGTTDPKLAANLDSSGLSRLAYTTSATSYKGVSGSGAVDGLTINGIAVTASPDMVGLIANINYDVAGVTATLQTDGSLLLNNITGSDIVIGGTTTNSGLTAGTYSGTKNLAQLQGAANADITVDGVTNISRASNTISDVVGGVSLKLKALGTTTVEVDRNDELFTTRLNAFLDAYNGLMDSMNNLQSYDKQTKATGTLFGDSTTRRIQSEVQNLLSNSVSGLPATLSHLTDLGVSTNTAGKLELDSSVFSTQLKDNFDNVVKFFTKTDTGKEGFALRMATSVEKILDIQGGTLAARTKGIQGSIDGLDKQILTLNSRMTMSETRLRTQFSSLEVLLGQYQNTSNSLTSNLDALQSGWGTK